MADNTKSTSKSNRQAYNVEFDYQILQHHMRFPPDSDLYDQPGTPDPVIYSVSKRNITMERALVDRGANGGIAGSDSRVWIPYGLWHTLPWECYLKDYIHLY